MEIPTFASLSEIIMSKKIKRILSTRYDVVLKSALSTDLEVEEYPLSIKEYDEEGHLVFEENRGRGGAFSDKFQYEYAGEKPVKQLIYFDEEELGQTEFYEYDEQGLLKTTIIEYHLDGSRDTITHSYDEKGRKISSLTTDEDGEAGQQEYWEYEGEHLVSYKSINDFGDVEEEERFKYDEAGRIVEQYYFSDVDESEYTLRFTYNEQGKVVLEEKFNAKNKLIEEKTFEYDEKGNLVNEQTANAKESLIRSRKYDEQGNEIYTTEKEEDEEGPRFEVWREFDEEGRVLKSKVIIYGDEDSPGLEYEVKTVYEFWPA